MILQKNFYFDKRFFTKSESEALGLLSDLSADTSVFVIDSKGLLKFYDDTFYQFYRNTFKQYFNINTDLSKHPFFSTFYKGVTSHINSTDTFHDQLIILGFSLKASYKWKVNADNVSYCVVKQGVRGELSHVFPFVDSALGIAKLIGENSGFSDILGHIEQLLLLLFPDSNVVIDVFNIALNDYDKQFIRRKSLSFQNPNTSVFWINKELFKSEQNLFYNEDQIAKFVEDKQIDTEIGNYIFGKSIQVKNNFMIAFQIFGFSSNNIEHQYLFFIKIIDLINHLFRLLDEKLDTLNVFEKENYVKSGSGFFNWEYHIEKEEFVLLFHHMKLLNRKVNNQIFTLQRTLSFFIPSDAIIFKKELQKIANNEKRSFSIELQLKPNVLFNSQYAKFQAYRYFDKFLRKTIIIGVFQDITKSRINEIKLVQAKLKAEELDRLKSSFLANMSHEIRTPLNGILGFSRLLSSSNLDQSKRDRYIDFIAKSGQNLLYLINDILDLAKIESGKFTIKIKDCWLNKLLDEMHQNFVHQMNVKEIDSIDIRLKKGVSDENFTIKTDPLRLRQVLNNLIGNSMKFTKTGYIEYGYTLDKEKNTLNFYVEDSGIGIPKDKMELIFSRFGKIENGRVINPGGTGLGLSIVKQIVEMLKGAIVVRSIENKGTRFDFNLPYKKGHKELQKEKSGVVSLNTYDSINVLVVEDNKINQQLILDTLMAYSNNIVITLAQNGKIALQKLENKYFDIVLMDIQMPIMDGYEATRAIRASKNKSFCNIPIIGLSAHAIKKEAERCLAIGMNSYLTKPFLPDVVLREIAILLEESNKEKQENLIEVQKSNTMKKMLDLSILKQMYGEDVDKLKSILDLYKQQIPSQIVELKKFVSEENWDSIAISSHALKGNLSYLGNDKLREFAYKIELNAKNEKEISKALTDFDELNNLWQIILKEIDEFLNE